MNQWWAVVAGDQACGLLEIAVHMIRSKVEELESGTADLKQSWRIAYGNGACIFAGLGAATKDHFSLPELRKNIGDAITEGSLRWCAKISLKSILNLLLLE